MPMTDNLYPFQLWEKLSYDVLRTLPHMILVLYAFRGHWRFGKKTMFTISFLVWVIEMTLDQLDYYILPRANMPVKNILEITIYILFIFVGLKEHIGKLMFTVLSLSNLGNIMVIGGKCLEGLLFPEYAPMRHHFTYTLCSLPFLAAELTLAYLLVFRDICTHVDPPDEHTGSETIGGFMWRFLWLVPAIFTLIWYQNVFSSGQLLLEYELNPLNTLYLLVITAGSLLIYRIIVQMTALYEKNITLLTENHALSVQQLQYDSLNERLENMRRTRHDLHHHAALLKEIRDSGDISALDDLIAGYTRQNRLDQPLTCCENETVNVVLALYSETAYQNSIAFNVKANIPKDISIDKKDLAVLFGNILENAADACKEVENKRFIDLTAAYTELPNGSHCLWLNVKNSFDKVSRDDNGTFHSTKHAGDGIGISSVQSIADRYNGTCSFVPEEDVFAVSAILYG